ncbi:aminopeptidase N [Luteococcus sp. Sow4_B9]|uniref:aminopeptidase N n=1 Tax=Luteococcus sp. Sow4_B9 TaxID=3438792 RepID=UPI003F96EE22
MNLTHDEARRRGSLLRVREVRISLDLTSPDAFTGSTTITVDCQEPGAETFVDFAGTSLDELVLNGDVVADPQWDGRRIHLPGLLAHNTITVRGTMAWSSDGEGLHRSVDPADGTAHVYAMSFLDAAPRWFACFDQPDLKASHQLDVLAPEGWLVRGNTRTEQEADGHWHSLPSQPISSYLVTLVAGPWVELTRTHHGASGPMTLGLLARPALADELHRDADDLFQVTAQSLAAYEELFGIPYAFGDYLQVFAPDFNAGAMENPGCVVLREQFLHRGGATDAQRASRAGTIAHELAHQWFGDLVTMRWWDDLWLNESFAEYLGHRICTEHTRYPLWAEFGLRRKTWGLTADQGPNTHPVAGNGAADTAAALANFDGISYAKGAAVLRQLATWMGDDAFFAGLRTHIRRHALGNASMAELVDAWRAQGVDGLDDWLDLWLGTSGVDRLAVVQEGGDLALTRRTPHQSRPRPHALRVAVHAPDGMLRDQTQLSVTEDHTPLPLAAEPGDLVLPDADDTAWALTSGHVVDGVLTDFPLANLPTCARVALVGSLQMHLHDACVAPAALLGMLLRALPGESDDTLLDAELDLALDCVGGWSRPEHRTGRRAELAHTCQLMLASTAPSSDRYLVLQRALVASSDDQDVIRGLLDDQTGRPLGAEERWLAVRRLVTLGADPGIIDAELARDPSSQGQLKSLTARAAIPDADHKRAMLHRVLHDDASAYEISAIARGLFLPEQHELVAPLAVDWFAGINATAAIRQGWGLTGTIRAGFPTGFADDQVRDAARKAIAQDGIDPQVLRALSDGFDVLVRQAVSWQQVDS